MDFHKPRRRLRDRLRHMRCRAKLCRFYLGQSRSGPGRWRPLQRRYDSHDVCCPSEKETPLHGPPRRRLWCCIRCRALARRRVHDQGYLAVSPPHQIIMNGLTFECRWCFYINLPIGAAVLVFLVLVVEDTPAALAHLPVKEKIARLDIYGTIIFVPCIVCLLLALQWGGQQYNWSDGRIIALLTLFGVLLAIFIVIQVWQQDSATVPPRIIKNRTVAAGAFYSFTLGSSFMMVVYYLSIWFQAIKGDTAIRSGYSTLPFILSLVVASIFSGVLVSRIGYYSPSLIAGAIIAPIGAGLLTLFKPDTDHAMWIGVQVLFGFGIGMGLQQTNIAAQTVLEKKDAPTGISIVFFGQGLGGTISVAIGQNILDNKLISGLSSTTGTSAQDIINAGATGLRNMFTNDQLTEVLAVYNHAIIVVFYAALGFSCATIFGALAMEWKSVKGPRVKEEAEEPAAA